MARESQFYKGGDAEEWEGAAAVCNGIVAKVCMMNRSPEEERILGPSSCCTFLLPVYTLIEVLSMDSYMDGEG